MTYTSPNTTETEQGKSLEASPLVEVTRTFRAPVERVWNALSDPELIKQWWGPTNFTAPNAETDFRVGGKYLFSMQGPDGKVIWSGGDYKEIIPDKKIVCTDHFSDKDGNPITANEAGMTGDWPKDLYITIELESIGPDQTKMAISHEGIPAEMHDDCVKGWSESVDKLQKLVERN
jgi:uncharacterized protein YndB with AHSA1/START domain